MNKTIYKNLTIICVYETFFLLLLLVLVKTFGHSDHEPIYYLNIIIYSFIAISCWVNLKHSEINREILIFIGIWTTIMTADSVVFIFQDNFSLLFNFYNYYALYLFSVGYRLFFSSYLFLFSLNPIKRKIEHLFGALLITIVVMSITFLPIFLSGEYWNSYDPLYSSTYYTQIFNFSMLLIFWNNYTRSKFIFSEYLSNIMSVWTIIVGLEIFHYFSSQNEIIFQYLVQYFYAILYLLISVLLILRLIYLLNPNSIENEKYIKNYYLLKGVIEKPRRGIFIEFYSSLNRINIIVFFGSLVLLGAYLYFFNKFNLFIRLNILLLIIASVISVILAIVTWHRRWYDAIGVLFKKNR